MARDRAASASRRRFCCTLAGVLVAPGTAIAQSSKVIRRIGYLDPSEPDSPEEIKEQYAPLDKLGWVEGQNLLFERRYANSKPELLRPFAEELVRLKVEIIITAGTAATLAAKSATNTIPIVFWGAGDPVGAGLVASLARPGGNVTGYAIVASDMNAKRLAVLHELLPKVQRVGVLEYAVNPHDRIARNELEQACRALGIEPIFVEIAAGNELANAVADLARRGAEGLVVPPDAVFADNKVELMRAALKYRLPTAVSRIHVRELGALVSYDPLESEQHERGASFVDRILRGAKPADLPVEQPTKFALIINLKSAQALGIAVPQSLLARADEVIR